MTQQRDFHVYASNQASAEEAFRAEIDGQYEIVSIDAFGPPSVLDVTYIDGLADWIVRATVRNHPTLQQVHDEHAARGENRWITCPLCDDEDDDND